MASTYLQKTFSTTGDRQKFTLSMWVKRGIVPVGNQSGTEGFLFQAYQDSGNQDQIWLQSNGTINYVRNNANAVTPSQMLRDPNAWYHIVFAGDTTQGSNADRLKVYINGTQAPIGQQDTITQGSNFGAINNAQQYTFGKRNSNDWYFDGSMSHIHLIDGTAYTPSAFGETDATTGEWKIKTSPSVTYGNNGFFILKDGNSVTDQSGNSNNFTVGGGTLTKTEDNPSNVFATMNPLGNYVAPTTLSQGNNTVAMTNSKGGNLSTLACTGGKYYSEMKIATMPQDSRFHIGILPKPISVADDPINTGNNGIMLSGFNAVIYANSGSGSASLNNFYGNATGRFSGTPILGCAVDLSSATKTMAISINGAWVTGSNTTDASFSNALKVDISTPVALEDDWFFGCGSGNGSGTTGVYNWNFGNGYFGTTAVSSAGTNASEIGIFEYDVPTGYTALSTKGLNL